MTQGASQQYVPHHFCLSVGEEEEEEENSEYQISEGSKSGASETV